MRLTFEKMNSFIKNDSELRFTPSRKKKKKQNRLRKIKGTQKASAKEFVPLDINLGAKMRQQKKMK